MTYAYRVVHDQHSTQISVRLTEQRRLPSQRELRKALERRIGDWFLFKQPPDKSFPATHQRHTRGIWTEQTRRDLLRRVRRSARLKPKDQEEFLRKLWRENDMSWLKTPFATLKRAVVRAQDTRAAVSPEVTKRLDKKFPGVATMRRLLDQDRIVNRGNAHLEVRSVAPKGDVLSGWTLNTPGVMIQFLRSGKLEEAGRNKLTEFGARVTIPDRGRVEVDRINVQKKSPQPLVWLDLVTKAKPMFEAEVGQVGATAATAGRFDLITGGGRPFTRRGAGRSGFSVVYGVRRSNFHEQFHFYEDPALHLRIGGRWTFRLLRLRPQRPIAGRESLYFETAAWHDLIEQREVPEALVWLARRADDPRPFIFRNDWEKEVAQAKRERTDLIWNHNAVKVLEKLGYFRDFKLEKALTDWKAGPRGKAPPRGGVSRNRPRGRLARPPEIFAE